MQNVFAEFFKRYTQWSLHAARREAANSFPRLRKMKGELVERYLETALHLEPGAQSKFVENVVKRRLLIEAAGNRIDGLALSFADQAFIERTFDMSVEPATKGLASDSSRGRGTRGVARSKLGTLIKARLEGVSGPASDLPGGSWFYKQECGPWTLQTYFDIGGRWSQLAYWHRIVGPKHYQLKGAISITSWMGIAGGPAEWAGVSDSDAATVVEHAAAACTEFLDAAPQLLADLPAP